MNFYTIDFVGEFKYSRKVYHSMEQNFFIKHENQIPFPELKHVLLTPSELNSLIEHSQIKFRTDEIPIKGKICNGTNFNVNVQGYSLDNFKTFNPNDYTILCRIGETCDGLTFFPKTSKLFLTINGAESNLIASKLDELVPKVANDLGVTEGQAIRTIDKFLDGKSVSVIPKGIQGYIYTAVQTTQNSAIAVSSSRIVSVLKTTGATGLQIIIENPLQAAGLSCMGGIFFSYLGSVASNNTVGLICNTTSYVLTRPMRVVEVVLNGLILGPIANRTGLPIILNGTAEVTVGMGLTVKEYSKMGTAFEKFINSKFLKKIKKIYKIILSKDND